MIFSLAADGASQRPSSFFFVSKNFDSCSDDCVDDCLIDYDFYSRSDDDFLHAHLHNDDFVMDHHRSVIGSLLVQFFH